MELRKATLADKSMIWEILQQAISQRKKDGSEQWQNGYPNEQIVFEDIIQNHGYVLIENDRIVAYAAIIFGVEPTYNVIQGAWLTDGDYAVVHRVATLAALTGKGIATTLLLKVEDLCQQQNVPSIKIDTNFDNLPMLRILEKLGYTYCGEIFFNNSERKAFEKVL